MQPTFFKHALGYLMFIGQVLVVIASILLMPVILLGVVVMYFVRHFKGAEE